MGRRTSCFRLGAEVLRLAQFSNPGDVVLNPFCGAGSLLWPAVELGRHAIGIEQNQECIQYLQEKGANDNSS